MTGFNSKRDAAADKLQEHDPCPGCIRGGVCRTPKCGRLALPLDHPFRNLQPAQSEKEKISREMTAEITAARALAQRPWLGLTDEDCKGMNAGDKVVAMWANRILKEKNT